MRLEGRVALVTGAASGLGESISKRFVQEGAKVIACDLDQEALDRLQDSLSDQVHNVHLEKMDVSNMENVRHSVEAGIEIFGRIDILVNNAGISPKKSFLEYTEADWHNILSVNLSGEYFCARAVAEHMMENKYGRIVNLSSSAWRSGGFAGGIPYTSAKAGVIGLTRSLAKTLGSYGITVNAVAPGPTATPLTDNWLPDRQDEIVAQIPLGRVGVPEDISNAVLFLASDEAAYITGICLDVNGGIAMGG